MPAGNYEVDLDAQSKCKVCGKRREMCCADMKYDGNNVDGWWDGYCIACCPKHNPINGTAEDRWKVSEKTTSVTKDKVTVKTLPPPEIFDVLHAAEAVGITLPTAVDTWWEKETKQVWEGLNENL